MQTLVAPFAASVGCQLGLGSVWVPPVEWLTEMCAKHFRATHKHTHTHTERQEIGANSRGGEFIELYTSKLKLKTRSKSKTELQLRLRVAFRRALANANANVAVTVAVAVGVGVAGVACAAAPKKKRKKKVFCAEVRHARPSSVVAVVAGAVLQIRDQNFVALKCTNKSAASSAADEQRHQQQQQQQLAAIAGR